MVCIWDLSLECAPGQSGSEGSAVITIEMERTAAWFVSLCLSLSVSMLGQFLAQCLAHQVPLHICGKNN